MNTAQESTIKYQPALRWLIPCIVILALIASGAGLFTSGGNGSFEITTYRGQTVEIYGQGIYQNDTLFIGAGLRGADAIVLFVGLPLLILAALLYRRGSLTGRFLLIGTLMYFLYIGVSLTFSAAFNPLFLIYTALFSTSLFALIASFFTVDAQALPGLISPRLPHLGTAVFLIFAGLATFLLWISEVIGPILNNGTPENLGIYTTMFTHGFDSATITPVAVLAGVTLLRKKPLGYLLTPPILLMSILNGLNVLAATASQTFAGLIFPPGVYIGMIGSWIVMGAFGIWLLFAFFRNLEKA